ncbi:helix-turn-helix domain-containing protein [Enterococcus sp. AZ072]|uniref:helix-turn-helix domain-containing protein n=1 Tax=unclassified Enterococcus TaxID=2608891 RepID=UPI003D26C73A
MLNYQEIKALFPAAVLADSPHPIDEITYFKHKNQYIGIPNSDFTPREKQLLKLLLPQSELSVDNKLWYQILFQHKTIKTQESYRLIQVKFQQADPIMLKAWQNEIKEILPALVDILVLERQQAILIEAFSGEPFSAADLKGIFLALDTDFTFSTKLFVGPFHQSNHDFTNLLQEEKQLFTFGDDYLRTVKCVTLPQLSVPYFSIHSAQDSYLLASLYKDWFASDELLEIIPALWSNHGNLSSTAKALFLHRNTLLYKLDKFQTETFIDLKNIDQLFLCYLILINYHY